MCFTTSLFISEKWRPFMKRENKFQADLIRTIKTRFPDSIVLKNDPNYIQGIPDLLVLHGDKWAALECKRSEKSPRQPNQDHYIQTMDSMSCAKFVYPENVEEVLDELQQTFSP